MAKRPVAVQTKPEVTVTVKCRYAGDLGDDYCRNCSGITMKVEDNGPDISCTECGGYEPEDLKEVEPERDEKGFMNIPDGIDEEVPFQEDPKPAAPAKSAKTTAATKTTQAATQAAPPATQLSVSNPNDTVAGGTINQPLAVVTEIRADSGLSTELVDKKGVKRWYKFNYGETRHVLAGANYEEEVAKLWEDVNGTVDDQLQQAVDFLNS